MVNVIAVLIVIVLVYPDVNVTDRANRLVGIVYGSQGAQLQQRALTNELLVQLTSAGIQIDPTQIRPLTFATDSVNISGSTISCKHVSDGVKRTLAFYDTVINDKKK